jgi:Lipoprotein LpqB beta-propeller domain/Sporulation and spore germination
VTSPPEIAPAPARRRLAPLALTACLCVVAAGGCATIPSSGPVRSLGQPQNGVIQGQDFPQLIPAPPGKGWTPVRIVTGFLAANASFAGNNAAAREYLTPGQARTWNPGSAVTVVSRTKLKSAVVLNRLTGQSGNNTQTVDVSGQELATLTPSGQYQPPAASAKQTISFPLRLMKIDGQWRIVNPPRQLLLSKPDFLRVYQPRNLYFFAPGARTLVPDPVYVPLRATATHLATDLVLALQQRPPGYLSGVTQTSLPPGTRVLGVRIEGPGAVVNLGGAVTRASTLVLDSIAAQLAWTLTSSSYGRQAINSVKLEVDGVPRKLPGAVLGSFEPASKYSGMVPRPVAAGGLYFIGKGGAVQVLPPSQATTPPRLVLGKAGTGLKPMTSIAVSPDSDERSIAGVSPGAGERSVAGISPDGRTVYFGALAKGAALGSWRPGGRITSLSWDASGDLWVAAGNGVWLRRPGRKAPVAVDNGQLPPGDRVTALRVAPDGVRIAMIVRGKAGSLLEIGGVKLGAHTASIQLTPIGSGISDPAQLSWYNPDNLIVLGRPGSAHPRLEEVPVSGGEPTPIFAEPHTLSIATAGSQIVAGLRGGRLVALSGPDGSWEPLGLGQAPAYPG